MKKYLYIPILLVTLVLTGCSEKDKAYYLNNLDKAEAKKAECRSQQEKAFLAKDKQKLESLRKDAECQAAIEAIREHQQAEYERMKQEKAEKQKEAIAEARKQLDTTLSSSNWQNVAHHYVNNECSQKWVIKEDDYSCLALRELYEEKVVQGKNELLQYDFKKLLAEQNNFCTKDKRKFSVCDIWGQALKEKAEQAFSQVPFHELSRQREQYCNYDSPNYVACSAWEKVYETKNKEAVDQFAQNYDVLKKEYNQCVDKLQKIGDHYSKYKERDAVTEYYPCSQAKQARIKLNLPYDHFKLKME
ncbi:hypothetical protein BMT54_00390 [Pasteurellaceae bacterium 15-036681]|nr:hypothetical protein BMT54_00390 [Pasteurellaceae bacterium 15-036681]